MHCVCILYAQYVNDISINIYVNDRDNQQKYCNILMYSYFIQLCEFQIATKSRNVYLLCSNSIKSKKSKTKKLMQQYANGDVKYVSTFPSHRQHAIDYFKV